jgi:hypothetical protein
MVRNKNHTGGKRTHTWTATKAARMSARTARTAEIVQEDFVAFLSKFLPDTDECTSVDSVVHAWNRQQEFEQKPHMRMDCILDMLQIVNDANQVMVYRGSIYRIS